MKKLITFTILLSGITYGATKPSIDLTFNSSDGFSTDDYGVPNKEDSAQVNLINLSSEHSESICYNGSGNGVIKMLDGLVEQAESSVKKYSRSMTGKTLNLKLSVRNALGKIQNFDYGIESCR